MMLEHSRCSRFPGRGHICAETRRLIIIGDVQGWKTQLMREEYGTLQLASEGVKVCVLAPHDPAQHHP